MARPTTPPASPSRCIAVLDALTQRPGEDVSSYLARCRANPVARDVKRHDLLDKLRPEYLAQLPRRKLSESPGQPVRSWPTSTTRRRARSVRSSLPG